MSDFQHTLSATGLTEEYSVAYPITIGSILECSIVGKLDDQICMTILHYRVRAASVLTDGDQLLSDVATVMNSAGGLIHKYADCCAQAYQLSDLRLQWITPTRYHYRSFAPIVNAGSVLAEPLPANVSGAITKRSVGASRHSHGNVHMPGLPQDGVALSEITGPQLIRYGALADKIDDVLTVGSTDEYEPVIYQRGNPAASEVVFDCSLHFESRVERRRTKGLGI